MVIWATLSKKRLEFSLALTGAIKHNLRDRMLISIIASRTDKVSSSWNTWAKPPFRPQAGNPGLPNIIRAEI